MCTRLYARSVTGSRIAGIVVLASCWTSSAPTVSFRMASPEGLGLTHTRCKLDGEPAPELREPILAFTRAHLMDEIEHITGYSSRVAGIETPVAQTACDHPNHGDGFFTEVIVTPRTRLGEVVVSQRRLYQGKCAWAAEVVYCLHVAPDVDGSSIEVRRLTSMLGLEPPFHEDLDQARVAIALAIGRGLLRSDGEP
jgi:hypothetical protein